MKPKCTVKILDEVNAQIIGLEPSIRRDLKKKYTFVDYRLKFLPQFKFGYKTPDVSFFTLSGKTYVNLLDEIIEYLQEEGYEIEIEDLRKEFDIQFPFINENYLADQGIVWPKGHDLGGKPIVLRDYQVDIINTFLDNIQGVQEVATGAGKTIIIATLSKILEDLGRTLVIVPNVSLIYQTKKDYEALGLDVGVFGGKEKNTSSQHIIATWQSIYAVFRKRKEKEKEKQLEELKNNLVGIIVDECHSSKAHILRNLLSSCFSNVPVRFGLTGTLPKNKIDHLTINLVIGPTLKRLKTKDLQRRGVLSTCDVYILQLQDETELFETYHEEKEYLLLSENRLRAIARIIEEIASSGNTLVLVDYRETGDFLHAEIEGSEYIDGRDDKDKRSEAFEKINRSDNGILIATYGIASTGINIPRLHNVVLIEPGKSSIRILQSIGRGVRKTKDKAHVNVYDICSTLRWSSKHMRERKKLYKESRFPHRIEKIEWSGLI